ALIVAIVPLWVARIEGVVLRTGDRLNAGGWIGLTLGVGGLVVLLWPQLSPLILGGGRALDRPFLVATVAVLLGSLSWSVGSVVSRRAQVSIGPFAATGWEMTLAGAVNFLITLGLGDLRQAQWTWRGGAAIAYLVTFGSLVGFTAYIWLLDNVPTPKVATYAYVNPVIAVLLGWMLAGELLLSLVSGEIGRTTENGRVSNEEHFDSYRHCNLAVDCPGSFWNLALCISAIDEQQSERGPGLHLAACRLSQQRAGHLQQCAAAAPRQLRAGFLF